MFPCVVLDGVTLWNRVTGRTPPDADGVEWVVTTMEGWDGSPAPNGDRTARPGGHGSYTVPAWRPERIITVDATVTALTDERMRAAEDRMAALCSDPERFYELAVTDERGTRTALVVLDGDVVVAPRDGLSLSSRVSLQLVAPDPRKYGPWVTVGTGPPTDGSGGIDSDPSGADSSAGIDSGLPGDPGTTAVFGTGTADSAPVVQLTGPVTNPVVWFAEIGCRLTVDADLSAEQTVWINCGVSDALDVPGRTLLLGGAERDDLLSVAGGWPTIRPGFFSTAQFTADAHGPGAFLTVHMRPAWW